jgi:hypothetical protein
MFTERYVLRSFQDENGVFAIQRSLLFLFRKWLVRCAT